MAVKRKRNDVYTIIIISLVILWLWRANFSSNVNQSYQREEKFGIYAMDSYYDIDIEYDNGSDFGEGGDDTGNRTMTQETLITDWDKWLQEQKRRRETLRGECGDMEGKDKYQTLIKARGFTGHLLVDDKHKTLYCFIPKVGSSTWGKVWMILTGLSNVTDLSEIDDITPHVIIGKMMLYTQRLSDDELLKKLDTYTKVIAVRHPFERLLSCYFDKIHAESGKLKYQQMVYPYVRRYRKSANLTNIEWHEFIDYVNSLSVIREDHWQSYEKLCHPCAVDYDYVVHFDTFTEDSERFLRLIDAPAHLHFPNFSSRVDSTTKDFYMKQLSEEQIAKLQNYYGRDFKLFQYRI